MRSRLLLALAGLLVASAGIHVWLLLTTQGAAFDMDSYRLQAFAVTHGLNVYDYTFRYPYPPVWIWIVDLMAHLSAWTPVPFSTAIRLPQTLGDLALTALLFEYRRARVGWAPSILVPAALWALNPIPAMVSAAHGQFDSLPMLFAVLAFHVRGRQQDSRPHLAALALGVAIALKGYPMLLLPYLALTSPEGRRLTSLLVGAIPTGVAGGAYVLAAGYSSLMPVHVLGYAGSENIGWWAVLGMTGGGYLRPLVTPAALTFVVALVAFATLVVPRRFGRQVELGAAAVFAFFYAVTIFGSIQYLLWGLPFFVLAVPAASAAFSAIGLAAMLGFYSTLAPGALPSGAPLGPLQRLYLPGVVGIIASGFAILWTCYRRSRSPAPQPLAAFAADPSRAPL